LFSTRFPVKKDAKKMPHFLGRRLLGAVWNTLARDHVLLLGARQQTKWSGGRGDEAVTLGHSTTSWGVRNPKKPSVWPLSSVVGAVAATLAGLEKGAI